MNKERRLGRGLEALLGQLPVRNDSAQPVQQSRQPELSETPGNGAASLAHNKDDRVRVWPFLQIGEDCALLVNRNEVGVP